MAADTALFCQKKLRRQAKAIFVSYSKDKVNLKMIHDESNVLADDELVVARGQLKKLKHEYLYIQNENRCGFCVK